MIEKSEMNMTEKPEMKSKNSVLFKLQYGTTLFTPLPMHNSSSIQNM